MTALPYQSATSGERAVQDMQKLLRAFGCASFGHMLDYAKGELLVQFEYRGQRVSVKAPATRACSVGTACGPSRISSTSSTSWCNYRTPSDGKPTMGTKSGELREMLLDAIEAVKAGNMKAADAKAIATLAQQVTASAQVELDFRRQMLETEKLPPDLGAMPLGHEESKPVDSSGGATLAAIADRRLRLMA
ncbi:MAG: hypothetical protein IT325_09965 [Anaerolineae bacterium]|nr:hypothetical protein [Anaerolineae bacterium]